MPNQFFNDRPEETEDTITYRLAELLRRRGMDATPQYKVGGGRHHDIHIPVDNLAIAVEAKKGQGGTAFKNAIKSADGRIDDNTADAAIALCYPNGCNSANVGNSSLMWAVRTRRTMMAAARPDFGGVDDLVGELRHIREYIGDPERLAAKLSQALDAAALLLPFPMQQTIAESVSLPPDKKGKYYNAAKRALLVVANTVMFHTRLESYFAEWHSRGKFKGKVKPQTARQCINGNSACAAFDKAWKAILEIDYKLIFKSARCIVQYNEAEEAVKKVAEAALEIAADPASLRHDLLGGLFHRALDSAKYDGSFYTTPASAVLLAGLSVDGENGGYRIIDPSCGTGTLLMAAAERYRDLRAIGGKDKLLHRRIVEHVMHGIDINITATQMAATTLGIISPKTDFAEVNIHQAKFGVFPNPNCPETPNVKLGALDYLDDSGGPLLVSPNPDGKQVNEDEEGKMPNYKDFFDLVIMNPPYTLASKRHGQMPEKDKKAMHRREKQLLGKMATNLHGNSGNFLLLAKHLTKKSGRFAAILPLVAATDISGLLTRQFMADNYDIETIVVPHDPKRFWFSGNTAISEMMVTAKRRAKGDKPKDARVVALCHNPDTPMAARRIVRLIAGGKKLPDWNVHKISAKQLAEDDWTAVQFASPLLLQRFYQLRGGKMFPVVAIGERGEVVSGRDTFTNCNQTEKMGKNTYPSLWNNDAKQVVSMLHKPDCYAVAKPGRERQAMQLSANNGRLKFPFRMRTSTARVTAVLVSRDAIGAWWESVKAPAGQEKALCLFANSSFGLLGILGVKNPNTLRRSELYKPYLAKLPVPVLKKTQAARMGAAFDKLSAQTLQPLPQMADDPARQEIDGIVADALGVSREVVDSLREALAAEPCISGKRAGEI